MEYTEEQVKEMFSQAIIDIAVFSGMDKDFIIENIIALVDHQDTQRVASGLLMGRIGINNWISLDLEGNLETDSEYILENIEALWANRYNAEEGV